MSEFLNSFLALILLLDVKNHCLRILEKPSVLNESTFKQSSSYWLGPAAHHPSEVKKVKDKFYVVVVKRVFVGDGLQSNLGG